MTVISKCSYLHCCTLKYVIRKYGCIFWIYSCVRISYQRIAIRLKESISQSKSLQPIKQTTHASDVTCLTAYVVTAKTELTSYKPTLLLQVRRLQPTILVLYCLAAGNSRGSRTWEPVSKYIDFPDYMLMRFHICRLLCLFSEIHVTQWIW